MVTDVLESFLKAEEEANRLVEVLSQLKTETQSYKAAYKALDQASAGVGELASRCAQIAERLGGLANTLEAISTSELLRRLDVVAAEVETLRKDLERMCSSIMGSYHGDLERIKHDLNEQHAGTVSKVETLLHDLKGTWRSIMGAYQGDLDRLKNDLNAQHGMTAAKVDTLLNELHEMWRSTMEAHQRDLDRLKHELEGQQESTKAALRSLRKLVVGSLVLPPITLALVIWVLLLMLRG